MGAIVGSRIPTQRTDLGKVVLALLDVRDSVSLDHICGINLGERLSRAPWRELEEIRQRGHSIDKEECEPGVGCVGGEPIAAISVSGPLHRILNNENKIASTLLAACREISGYLGYEAIAGRGAAESSPANSTETRTAQGTRRQSSIEPLIPRTYGRAHGCEQNGHGFQKH